jgi:hypothetical protein
MRWRGAESACVHLGGHLASISTQDESDFVKYSVVPGGACTQPYASYYFSSSGAYSQCLCIAGCNCPANSPRFVLDRPALQPDASNVDVD